MGAFRRGEDVCLTGGAFVGCTGHIVAVIEDPATYNMRYRVDLGAHGKHTCDEDMLVLAVLAPAPPVPPVAKYPATLVPGMPHDAQARKQTPVYSGVLKYFPHALAEVAKVSYIGNDKHSPGKEMTWDRSKSSDEMDADIRHTIDEVLLRRAMPPSKHVVRDADGNAVLAQAAWRVLARLEKDIEAELAAIAAERSTK